MAYVFDPINNTLIDDEDKSLGNKFALLDSDLEKAIRELNEKFGPGTVQQGTQGIPQPPIKTPQAIFEFEERMKGRMADGGRVNFQSGTKPGVAQRLGKPNKPIDAASRTYGNVGNVITKEEFIKEYKKFLESDAVNKSDRVFAEILNKKGYTTTDGKPLGDAAIYARRKRYNIKGVVEGGKANPDIAKRIQNVNEYLSDLIFELNGKNRYYSLEEVQNMVRDKFKFSKTVSLDRRTYPIFNQLLDREQKVEQLLKKMLVSDEPLNTSFIRYIRKEVGGARRKTRTGPIVENLLEAKTVINTLKKSPTYKTIKDQGADLLKDRYNQNKELFKLSFSDQLTEALDLAKGQPVFVGMDKEKYYSSSPKHKVMSFAKRSWNIAQGKGPIKFFDGKGNEIKWRRGLKLPYRNVSFTYEGKKYSMKELDNLNFVKKNFPEVYDKQLAVNQLRAVDVDNPYAKGKKIPLLDLLKENSRRIYGWRPKRNTFDVLHGKEGIALKPFTDLSFNSRDVNQMQLGVELSRRAGKISKTDADKIINFMDKYTGSGDIEKIKQRQISLTNDFLAGKVDSYGAERDRILSAAKKIPAVKKYAASQGITLNSFAGFLDFSQAGLELPPAIKQATDDILKIGGQVLRTGGKAAIVLDPMFAATDISEAFSKGASGKQAVNYAVGRFFEGLTNLPDLAASGAKFGFDKLRGKDTEFETGVLYEPKTFAQDYLKNVLEQTPEEVLEARKAQLEFDQNVLPGMTMVDDIDIPASKTEIEAARDKFMDEKGIDLSVLDEPKPDKTFNQFLANGGRVGFSNGGAAGADENFAAELEYFLTNEDAELPQLSTYSEPNNPIQIINDIIDPRNYPYYADVLARSGVRIGEFATRILPATGKLINDLITKPAFKIERPSEGVSKKSDYVQEYTDILPSNIKGTGIFSEFLKNITPTATEKFIGLDKLIEKEEQKQKDRGSTVGPKVLADTIGLGAEVTAPIFPGLKVAQKILKPKKVAAAVENRKTGKDEVKKLDVDSDAPAIPKPSGKFEDLSSIENLELNLAILKATKEKDVFDPVIDITRDLAERILIKKGIEIGGKDPIDVFDETFGDIIVDVKNLAEEILEANNTGRTLKPVDELLKIDGFFDMPIPKEPNQGIPIEDTINMLEKDLREKKMLESFTTKDKIKNAKGGIIK